MTRAKASKNCQRYIIHQLLSKTDRRNRKQLDKLISSSRERDIVFLVWPKLTSKLLIITLQTTGDYNFYFSIRPTGC